MKNDVARLVSSGNLAGSTTTLRRALLYLKTASALPLPKLAWMDSFLPAKLLGVDGVLGSLEKGKVADIVVLDEEFAVKAVFVRGEQLLGVQQLQALCNGRLLDGG